MTPPFVAVTLGFSIFVSKSSDIDDVGAVHRWVCQDFQLHAYQELVVQLVTAKLVMFQIDVKVCVETVMSSEKWIETCFIHAAAT